MSKTFKFSTQRKEYYIIRTWKLISKSKEWSRIQCTHESSGIGWEITLKNGKYRISHCHSLAKSWIRAQRLVTNVDTPNRKQKHSTITLWMLVRSAFSVIWGIFKGVYQYEYISMHAASDRERTDGVPLLSHH